jgi:iron-sulfur cluster assembly accessory protein
MLQGLDVQTITITPTAAQAVKNILDERKLEGYALRVYVAGGGCCGVNFGMALDNNFQEADTTIDTNGVKLVIDQGSMEYLQGATIDFINDPQHGQGFAINSPNAKKKSKENGEGGDCGGSCSCNN